MKTYIKEINGVLTIRHANKIIIINDDMQTINPTHDMIVADGWVEYSEGNVVQTVDKSIEDVKSEAIERVLAYDSSEEVNCFFVNGEKMWLDKSTRASLMMRVDAELEDAKVDTTLWFDGVAFSINLDYARKMLKRIELYASQCYDNTQRHIANIRKANSIDEVESYIYTNGYPEKLEFNV
jgi:hypothetical protein